VDKVIMAGGCFPTLGQELLLRAAFLQDQNAMDAWHVWKAHADLNRIDYGSYRLLPLVYQNLKNLDAQDEWMGRLRGIHRNTWYKNNLLMGELASLLREFRTVKIPTLVLKGAALALLYYRDPGLRPMLDADVLVPLRDAQRALARMNDWGWRAKFQAPHARGFITGKGSELDLHWHVLAECCEADADEDFWADAITLRVVDVETRALNPTDQLFHVCAHGLAWNPVPPVRWAADAMVILRSAPVDWARFVMQARKRHLALTVRIALEYLCRTLHAPIPSDVLQDLDSVPISRAERWDYSAKTIPPHARDPFLVSWAYLREYHRAVMNESCARKILAFPGFIQSLWSVEHIWQLPFYAAVGAFRRIVQWLSRGKGKLSSDSSVQVSQEAR
jgi:hypothetical protein